MKKRVLKKISSKKLDELISREIKVEVIVITRCLTAEKDVLVATSVIGVVTRREDARKLIDADIAEIYFPENEAQPDILYHKGGDVEVNGGYICYGLHHTKIII